jgi:NTE family protein
MELAKEYKCGLVLSGGVTRCFAHLGVLKAMEEMDLKPDIISAVSAGSIIGALYADGMKPENILEVLTSNKLFKYLSFSFRRKGLMQLSGFHKIMDTLLVAKNIEDLKIPMIIYAVNLNKAAFTGFNKGNLLKAITASSSLPVIFPPVKIGEDYYADGGVINNFPIDPLIGRCRILIGVNVNPISPVKKLGGFLRIAGRAYRMAVRSHTLGKKIQCDYYIEPPGLANHGLLEMNKASTIFQLGYDEAIRVLAKPPETHLRQKA